MNIKMFLNKFKQYRKKGKGLANHELFHDGGPYHIESSSLIFRANE